MLAVAPQTIGIKDERERTMDGSFQLGIDEFLDFSDTNLLDSIDFEDLFMGMDGGDVLPDLEMDPELFAEFSCSGGEEPEMNTSSFEKNETMNNKDSCNLNSREEEIVSKKEKSVATTRSRKEGQKGKKSSLKNSQGKRKVKVDWTPELHRRFVQAVEQLGVDKAVPSRILELMGIDCLTRHNIASHLQKYRSHRKHLLAREAEASNWSQRRKIYAPASAMGFPPMVPPPMQHFRPLHVWGHPSIDQSAIHKWPKHLVPLPSSSSALATWVPPLPYPRATKPPSEPSFWHHHHKRVPNSLPVTPCFPQPMPTVRFPSVPVTGIPPPTQLPSIYRLDTGGLPNRPTARQPPFNFHPTKESIDAAIGDVLSKPWSPLPLGLKPPSVDGVLVELQRQGVSNIPPSSA